MLRSKCAIPSLLHKLTRSRLRRDKNKQLQEQEHNRNRSDNSSRNNNRNGKSNDRSNRKNNRNRSSNRRGSSNRNRKGKDLAIVHVAMKSSSKAPPAAAHADYIARDGKYGRRGGVELVESGNMPEFAQADPRAFWVAADTHERANGRAYTELQIALPRELDKAQRIELAREAAREFLGDRFAYTLAVHQPLAKDNIEQPHLHLMFSERAIDETTRALPDESFFKRNGAKKDPAWNDRNKPEEVRVRWCEMMNRAMEREGIEVRVESISWEEQGREDLAELREPKTLGGKGEDAVARQEEIAELRRKREELPAPDFERAALVTKLHKEAKAQIAEIEARLKEEMRLLERLIAKAKQALKRTAKVVRSVLTGVKTKGDVLMEEIEQGAAKEHAAAAEAEKKTTEAAIRAKRETDRAAAAEAARKVEDAKLIEPATTANAALLEIANRIEQRGTERVSVSRQEAAIFADAMAGVGLPGRLHGQGRGAGLLKVFEDGGRLPIGETRRQNFKELANIEVSRTAKGFEYAIVGFKDRAIEFLVYLRKVAVKQLDWDTKVLKSRSKQKEQPVQARQPKNQSLGR
jgi:hypothetical protein